MTRLLTFFDARRESAASSGAGDDSRDFQISLSAQPRNSFERINRQLYQICEMEIEKDSQFFNPSFACMAYFAVPRLFPS